MVGVELDEEGMGKNNGTVKGVSYFKCEKQGGPFGIMVRPSEVSLVTYLRIHKGPSRSAY
jgi:dynactin complex subunit